MKNILLVLMALLSLVVTRAYAQDFSETAKIQHLIASIEVMEGVRFIRNGHEHDALAASNHLRLKLKAAGNKIKTAEDFIKLCASKSSMTGKPYLIRFADGTIIESEVVFREKLKTFAANKP